MMVTDYKLLAIYLIFACSLIFPLFGGEEPYRLKIGDRLSLSLYGESKLKKEVTVGPTGTINYLNILSIPALGKTIDEVRRELTEKLKKDYRYPVVGFTAAELIGEHYSIIGEVRSPGRKPLIGGSTILSALCNSGGFTTRIFRDQTIDLMDFDRSFLTREGKYVPVDFRALVEAGDMSQDLPLKNGDFIYIASYVMPKVYVLGMVNKPVAINYLDTISLAEAIAEAGGRTLRASSRVAVIRGALACPETFLIDFNRIVKGHACNFWLEPGDIVFVPPMKFTNLKEFIQGGITAFVSTLLSVAGTNTYLEVNPAANTAGVISPVPTINSGTTQGVILAPPVP